MTNKEIMQALRCSATKDEQKSCDMCQRSKRGCFECINSYLYEAASLIEQMTAENAALREKVPQWISVEERMPIDRLKKYLVAFQDAGGPIVDMARYFPSDGWTCDNWDVPQALITHWMPLPEAPEEGDKHGKTD